MAKAVFPKFHSWQGVGFFFKKTPRLSTFNKNSECETPKSEGRPVRVKPRGLFKESSNMNIHCFRSAQWRASSIATLKGWRCCTQRQCATWRQEQNKAIKCCREVGCHFNKPVSGVVKRPMKRIPWSFHHFRVGVIFFDSKFCSVYCHKRHFWEETTTLPFVHGNKQKNKKAGMCFFPESKRLRLSSLPCRQV